MNGAELEALLENVREDPDLLPEEKETSLYFSKRDDDAAIYTAEAALTRRLLAHPETDVVEVTALEDGRREGRTLEAYGGEDVVGAHVRVPIGALKIRRSARATTQHAPVVGKTVLPDGGRPHPGGDPDA